ncbi:MAG: hypothetical protein ACFE8Z_07700, partial [Candidatus Hermodarchaeota archaeon]
FFPDGHTDWPVNHPQSRGIVQIQRQMTEHKTRQRDESRNTCPVRLISDRYPLWAQQVELE